MTERIPLSVVGGYLGAGKTTLLNHILTGDHGRRVAVIVNDFGDVNIDEALLGPASGGVWALANGCVCCAAVDGLATALSELAALEPRPEHVIIEVSGVGDPWAVAQWGRTPGFVLDGVVVVVDPGSVGRWLDDPYVGDTVRGQIRGADLVLISHADDQPEQGRSVAEWLPDLTPAPVLIGTDIGLDVILGRPLVGAAADAAHADHVAVTFVPVSSSRSDLRSWLERAPSTVVRVKGFVAADEGLLVAQRFGHRVEVTKATTTTAPVMSVVCVSPPMSRYVHRWTEQLGRTAQPPGGPKSPSR